MKKNWTDCEYKLYLNTEHKSYSHEGIDVSVLNLSESSTDNQVPWGKRTKDCVKRIQTTYTIMMLEDFFLQKDVQQQEIDNCIDMMDNNPNIVAIYFKRISGYEEDYCENEKYYCMSENKPFKLNLQAGIWRTEALVNLIEDDDNPWQFEYASSRASDNMIFLCSKYGSHSEMENSVFPYLLVRSLGYGIWEGRWLWNNKKLFLKNGFTVDKINMKTCSFIQYKIEYFFTRVKGKLKRMLNK